ncbi:MAG TPA: glycosyltransferase [Candidatus Angelobacter sp.]|nr:glycosyltransferase [Candidatus Angelobacter sp.]
MTTVEQISATTNRTTPAGTVLVSIVIPALNEEKMIGRCLEALAKMDFAKERFEVILVDNGSTDRTREIAESFRDRLNLRILEKRGVRISALRNFGAQEARGGIVAFLDADCLAPKDWLERMIALVPAQGAGIVGAHYLLPENSTWVGRTWHRYQEAEKRGEVSHVPAGDLIMRREDFLRIGGFDESIQTNEDYELCERARANGLTVRAVPEIGVVHLGTAQSLRAFFRKQAWHGTHVVKVFLRNISGSDNWKAVAFAGWILFGSLAAIAGSVWAVFDRGMWWAPVAAIGAMLLPPVALATKQVIGSRESGDFFPLMALYLTYGVARAKALLRLS